VLERRVSPRPNLQFLSVDFTATDIETELRANPRFHADLPTLFLMEGLTMYLSEEEIAGLFRAFRTVGGAQTQLIFTFMEPQADGKVNFPRATPLVTRWLRRRGESFRWGIHREELSDYLLAQGFQMDEIVDDVEFRKRYLNAPYHKDLPLAEGEFLCTAIRQRENEPPEELSLSMIG